MSSSGATNSFCFRGKHAAVDDDKVHAMVRNGAMLCGGRPDLHASAHQFCLSTLHCILPSAKLSSISEEHEIQCRRKALSQCSTE